MKRGPKEKELVNNWQKTETSISVQPTNTNIDKEAALFAAVQKGDVASVRYFIVSGADVNAIGFNGRTALVQALKNSSLIIIQLLLDAGANNEVLIDEMPLLHFAIYCGRTDITRVLINTGVNKEALYCNLTPLHYAIYCGRTDSVRELINAGVHKEALYKGYTPLYYALSDDKTDIAQALIDAGANKKIPFNILRTIHDQNIIEALFFDTVILGCTLSSLFSDPNYFGSFKRKQEFLSVVNPISYLLSNRLISLKKLTALRLLDIAGCIKAHEASLLINNETAMDDSKVARALWHFKNKLQPYYEKAFLAYSKTQDKEGSLCAIEKEIRELLLNNILKQANEEHDTKIMDFVDQNKAELLTASDEIMKASCGVFTSKTNLAQAAWRGYNPHAPVVGATWPNLLTPPALLAQDIWTTPTAHQNALKAKDAFDILRERIAYYYLAVIDQNHGDEHVVNTRIQNFISQLADIRNAHGIDDPSCYPGTLTRIADMGAFHDLAQLPISTKEWLDDFFREKALAAFQNKMATLASFEKKQALLYSLTELTQHSAKGIIENPDRYPDEWLILRREFISSLGTPTDNLKDIFERDLIPVTNKDIRYVTQFLFDIGKGKNGAVFSDYFNRATDRVPTKENIEQANPFMADRDLPAHTLCATLLEIILNTAPLYANSVRHLKNLSNHLEQTVPLLVKGRSVNTVLAGLDIPKENQKHLLNTITLLLNKNGWQPFTVFINPFDNKINQLKTLMNYQSPAKTRDLPKKFKSFENMQALFNKYLPIVQEIFTGPEIQNEDLTRITEELAIYLAKAENGFDLDEFEKQINIDEIKLINHYKMYLNNLAERINKVKPHSILNRPSP